MDVRVTCECGNRFDARVARDVSTTRCPDCRQPVLIPTAAKQRRRRAAAAVSLPGKALLVVGGLVLLLGSALFLFGLVSLVNADTSKKLTEKQQDQATNGSLVVVGAGVGIIAYSCAIMAGALALRDLRSYNWAVAGCALGMLAIFPVGAIVSVWVLTVIMRPEIRSKFGKRPDRE